MKCFFALFFLLLFSPMGHAAAIPDDAIFINWFKQLNNATFAYQQTKNIPEIDTPLKSTGIFQFVKDKGIFLKKETPSKYTFVASTEAYCISEKREMLKELPYFEEIKSIIDELLIGDLTTLYRLGEISYFESKGKWSLDMIPTQKDFSQFISKIHLNGDKIPQRINIEYKNKTKIEIILTPKSQDFSNEIEC